jgi:anaerobic magnesium-protoporphyrin IX monomethyl ester cyclase
MKRVVLLVVPPQRGLLEGFSKGLIAIANFLDMHGQNIEVRLLDFSFLMDEEVEDQASKAISNCGGALTFIGITGTTASYQGMLLTARTFKLLSPSCIVIFGGHHASAQDDIILEHHSDHIDFIVRGEGERSLLALTENYPSVVDVPNLSYVDDGELVRTQEAVALTEGELCPSSEHLALMAL